MSRMFLDRLVNEFGDVEVPSFDYFDSSEKLTTVQGGVGPLAILQRAIWNRERHPGPQGLGSAVSPLDFVASGGAAILAQIGRRALIAVAPCAGAYATADDALAGSLSLARSPLVGRILAKINLYPKIIDARTGRHIPFPCGIQGRVLPADRVPKLTESQRNAFKREWARRGYETPRGGWDNYDIHHIQPREFGGTNDFWNLVPVEWKKDHKEFNRFWGQFDDL